MTTFLLDIWHDLRQKKLWPVAILLAVALMAVPLVLRKPAEEVPPPAVDAAPQQAQAADAEAETLAVKALEEGSVPPSDLDTFDAKNPFRPLVKERSVEEVADQLGSTQSPPESAPSASTDPGAGESGGGTGSGGGGDAADPGDGDDGTEDKPKTTTTSFTYVADVTFIAGERERRIKGLDRLDILPSSAKPLLLFLGVSDDAGNAVFLVDSTLSATGEGRCTPSTKECAFVHLGPGSVHMFTNEEGDSYTLQIDEIRRVEVKPERSAKARSSKKRQARAAVRPVRHRFVPPFLTDVVVETTGTER